MSYALSCHYCPQHSCAYHRGTYNDEGFYYVWLDQANFIQLDRFQGHWPCDVHSYTKNAQVNEYLTKRFPRCLSTPSYTLASNDVVDVDFGLYVHPIDYAIACGNKADILWLIGKGAHKSCMQESHWKHLETLSVLQSSVNHWLDKSFSSTVAKDIVQSIILSYLPSFDVQSYFKSKGFNIRASLTRTGPQGFCGSTGTTGFSRTTRLFWLFWT